MSEVSVIGLGEMGTALARVLLQKGYHVTVWNRTRARAEQLVQEGSVLASDATSAISVSPVVIICVADYETAYCILQMKEVTPTLSGRVLVQLSTGTPQQARDSEVWAKARGIDYLDGAITATPSQMGRPNSTIFVSGAETAFRKSEHILKSLAGNVMYLGEQVSTASSMDLAFLSYLFGSTLGFFHAARVLEADGLPVDTFGSMMALLSLRPLVRCTNVAPKLSKQETTRPPKALLSSVLMVLSFLCSKLKKLN
jgi:3-hydroxyisobutyrate dehydrogenase-like beta-hydroxyacid dehydrogenase